MCTQTAWQSLTFQKIFVIVTPRVIVVAIEEVIDDGTNGLQAKAIHVVASAALRIPEGAVLTALFD